ALHLLGDLDLPGDHSEERAILALVNGVLPCAEMNVSGGLGDALEILRLEPGEQGDGPNLVDAQHGVVNPRSPPDGCPRVPPSALRTGGGKSPGAPGVGGRPGFSAPV